MGDCEEFDPIREKQLELSITENFDLLSQKTVNFEDLVTELFGQGCLSLDEKFKVLSGVVEEKSSNKTTQDKCFELYSTLKRKDIVWSKVLKCWEETGNDYLFGRFATHFVLEGRDTKSQKYTKFKSLPHNRTEFITHLSLRNVQIAPRSLLKCLRKSNKMESIILEKVKIPHGGRGGEDPAYEFDQTIILPNLRNFYLEEITQHKSFKTVKEVTNYLDELNLKAIMFFAISILNVAANKVSVNIQLRGATMLKMIPRPSLSNEEQDQENCCTEFVSMLRRRPEVFGGLVQQEDWTKVCCYECFVPKAQFCEFLTHLNLYRCRINNFNSYVTSCYHLVELHLHAEFDYEESKVAEFDLSSMLQSKTSLTKVSFALLHLTNNVTNTTTQLVESLSLESLSLDCCIVESENLQDLYELLQRQKRILWKCGYPHPSPSFLESVLTTTITEEIVVSHFDWNSSTCDTKSKESVREFLKSSGPPSMVGDETQFVFQKNPNSAGKQEWASADTTDLELESFLAKYCSWNVFAIQPKSWIDLPLSNEKGNSEHPKIIFCNVKNQKQK